MNKNMLLHNYYRILIDNDASFNILKESFTEISEDLLSSKENPSCECNRRVFDFLYKRYNSDKKSKKIIDNLFELKEINEIVTELEKQRIQLEKDAIEKITKIYKVGKSQKYWSDFYKTIEEKNINFRSFSILEKDDHLEIRFL